MDTKDISWEGLIGNKFKSVNKSEEWLDIESNRFVNWMMPNTYFSTYKAWFRPTQDILPGEYIFQVKNSLDTELFSGSKYFGFEEYSPIGAKNLILTEVMFLIFLMSVTLATNFYFLTTKEKQFEADFKSASQVHDLRSPLVS